MILRKLFLEVPKSQCLRNKLQQEAQETSYNRTSDKQESENPKDLDLMPFDELSLQDTEKLFTHSNP